jgi:hypothetical protein
VTSARPLTDEERYVVELDSAFDDYDAAMSSRDRARERAQARREAGFDDEAAVAPVSLGPNYILLGLATLAGLGLLFLLYSFLTNRDPQLASAPTATAVRGGAGITETVEAGPTAPLGGGAGTSEAGPTASLSGTGPFGSTATPPPLFSGAPVATPPMPGAPTPTQAGLANANPAPVDPGTQLEVNGWIYSSPDICGGTCAVVIGPQVGSFTAQPGNAYITALVFVANNTGTPQPLPPNFFVVKDAQGNIYNPQPDVSSAYVIRGVNADIGMEDQVPANGVIPLSKWFSKSSRARPTWYCSREPSQIRAGRFLRLCHDAHYRPVCRRGDVVVGRRTMPCWRQR